MAVELNRRRTKEIAELDKYTYILLHLQLTHLHP